MLIWNTEHVLRNFFLSIPNSKIYASEYIWTYKSSYRKVCIKSSNKEYEIRSVIEYFL